MGRLDRVWLQIQQLLLSPGNGRTKERWSHYSKLFTISDILTRERLFGGLLTAHHWRDTSTQGLIRGLPWAWHVQFGTWLDPFLTRPNHQVALLVQGVLDYDLHDEFWEGRLLRYILFQGRINRGQARLLRKIKTLFDELSLPIDRRHPQTTKERFERALKRLEDDGHIARAEILEGEFPAREWIDCWLSWSVDITLVPSPKRNITTSGPYLNAVPSQQ